MTQQPPRPLHSHEPSAARDVSGVLNINKPSGVTSFWVVKQVRRILGVKRTGHCGTLDPMAEGVLLIVFGSATRHQNTFMAGAKTYRARMQLGVTTNTGDATGKTITQKSPEDVYACLDRVALLRGPGIAGRIIAFFTPRGKRTVLGVETVLKRFTGTIQQVPPMFSALKYHGRRLYELARKGETVVRQPRTVKIYRIEILSLKDTVLEFRVECSRGTYIRTLCEDIGAALGCGATMSYLCREKVGTFDLSSAVDGKSLSSLSRGELLKKAIQKDSFSRHSAHV